MKNKLRMTFALSGAFIFFAQSTLLAVSLTKTESNQQKPSSSQKLPISAQAKIAGQTIYLEVAQTPKQQTIGLINRSALANNRGMLFPIAPPRIAGFWMKDVLIPLDIVFLQNKKVVGIAAKVPPCSTKNCPIYSPAVNTARRILVTFKSEPVNSGQAITSLPKNIKLVPVDQVIELRGGRAAELGLKKGDSVAVTAVPQP